MRYVPLPWDENSHVSSLLIIISIITILMSTFKPSAFEGIRVTISDTFAPVLSVASLPFQRFSLLLHDITGFAQLQADNARLEQENARLRDWYQTALLLNSENKSLRKLLNLKIEKETKFVSARVIADSGNTYVKSILAVVGRDNNIQKGSAVLSGEGLIGRIIEVGETAARILLVTDINSRVPVVVEDTGHHAIMAGANERLPHLIHLPQESEISNGARLITSGYGGIFPQGIPVGRALENEYGGFNVMLFADFNALQIVRIIQNKKEKPVIP